MSPNTIKILHIDSNNPLLWNQLETLGFQNEEDFTSTKEEIESKIHKYHGIVIRSRFKIDKTFIDKATNLQFIARVGAGLESIDCDYATSKNIQLIAAPEGNRNAVGEQALGMLLSLFNNLNKANSEVKNGQWNREANRGHELDGKTVGLIGYGNMGKAFAKKLRGFDVNALCYDIQENVADANAKQVALKELQEKADVLSLHIPWTAETDKMVNADFINVFQKPIWLINTARGKSVVTSDLVEALKSGKVLGAGLDVLEYEKLSFENLFDEESKNESFEYLRQAENVLLTPHIAGWTFESHEKLAQTIVDKIKAIYHFICFWWKDEKGDDCSTQWSPFKSDTNYFEPSEKQFMQNFRVHDLETLLKKLLQEGVTIIDEMQTYEYGKFAWILDPEKNKIELWEPIDSAFK